MKTERIRDLTVKLWRHLLKAAERPRDLPLLVRRGLQGVHIGEFLNLNQPWFRQLGIETVLDVGAHKGEFSSAVLTILPQADVYAFEPLPDCFKTLVSRCDRLAPNRFHAYNVAVGDASAEAILWRSAFSKSSSLLPMAPLHRQEFPWTAETWPQTIKLITLDDWSLEFQLRRRVLLKIDVQGYESHVLQGAGRMLDEVDYVYVEVSFRPLYDGQGSFHELYEFLTACGFTYIGGYGHLTARTDCSILQEDALFRRNDRRLES